MNCIFCNRETGRTHIQKMATICDECSTTQSNIKLFLDDKRLAPDGWLLTTNAQECIDIISTGIVDELSLDHDLGTIRTGYDVIAWLEEEVRLYAKDMYIPYKIFLHTANPVGRKRMEQAVHSLEKYIAEKYMIQSYKLLYKHNIEII